MNVNRKIPISFQKLDKFDIQSDDTRFLPVKIWLMHLGENFNGSYFSKDVVEQAIPTLANTPILAYIEDNSEGELDFSDHRQSLVIKDGSFDVEYQCSAIGLIPETNNAQFEDKLCDDGETRTFLTVEGLVWKKWDDPTDILNREQCVNQSMELSSDYQGEVNKEDGLFHFTNFKFFGACALGMDYQPAMIDSTIETKFSMDKFQKVIQEKMEQFKVALSSQEGGIKMEEPILETVLVEETTPQEQFEVVEPSTDEVVEELPVEEVVEEPVIEFDYKVEYEKLQEEIKSLREQFEVEKATAQDTLDKAYAEFAKLQEDYSKLEESAKELEQFKLTHIQKEREDAEEALFTKFSKSLTEDEMLPIKEKKAELTLGEIEEKLFALVGRKGVVFSKTPIEEKPIRYNLPVDNKPPSDKEWADLIEKHKNK